MRSQSSAMKFVERAIKAGTLVRPDQCEVCTAKPVDHKASAIVGHHWNGYDDPLNVWFVCRSCNRFLANKHDGSLNLEQARIYVRKRQRALLWHYSIVDTVTTPAPLTFGSLFSGIGGFDLGMERAGLQPIWQCENNKDCQRVLKRHWANTRLYQNVKEINRSNTATPDVLMGGFPCQDLSIAGKREGLAGERSGLWFEFHRIIKELAPRWIVIENVPGLLSSNSGEDFAVILRGLAECGYYAAWRILDAQYFGLAQRRRRVFIVASLGNGSCAQVLFESESGAWDSPPGREAGEGFAAAITERTRDAGRQLEMQDDLAYALTNPGSGGRPHSRLVAFQQNTRDEVRLINGDGQIAGALAAEAGMKQQNYIASTLNSGGNNGGFRTEPGEHLVMAFAGMAQGGAGWAPASMPVAEDQSLPLDATRAATIAGNFGVRRLTPVECERLQGFPDGWTEGQSDSVRYRQLGNAVAVPCAEWIGRRISKQQLALL